ncbi:bromodomain associated, putative [Entamoeba histolytica HM-1:IMSS-B]|uniref:Transcription initiation factor TFIID subunit 8 n=6 Tax=Entamoeba histolytica TaxID=5759 RepID=C4MB87_ENTH1|nr:hypothetical protein EHI_184680 [Entamoeba histolytica HM-1:IMSS]EMD42504.1 bromodomain associated protein [Entamoeba histolytica KU27]EMH76900.1 bromodomain associated, putative [Entamoeba histolytica HM-1:IMSS-B]EMS16844.1 bromodomain associated protein [Entamoeba histolytica HM-3:IMSS]ENY65999.1 bromodomain associated protein [Entamoeba histolytica HM-1:IMSS-A]GAT99202.1 hypothetical protein CL6EHI_184680 [Entamoeba histolytica]|eukprot:XP_656311.1 hypothetical protein EHI_184680 [Entamoeba histolytica HM-1:IMSS]
MSQQVEDSFPRKILKIAAAQIAMSAGYTDAKESALETIADVMEMYIQEIGKKTHQISEHNGRTESSFIDLLFAMEQLGIDIFSFGDYVTKEDKLFIDGIPEFPVIKATDEIPIEKQHNEEKPYIPGFLPPLPDARTYKNTPIYQKRHTDGISLRKEELKVRHLNEDALINLKNKINGEMKVNYENGMEEEQQIK